MRACGRGGRGGRGRGRGGCWVWFGCGWRDGLGTGNWELGF